MALAPARKFVKPLPGETWEALAQRALPQIPAEDAVAQLQSWNFHVFMRPAGNDGNVMLPSDVLFVEAPKPGQK